MVFVRAILLFHSANDPLPFLALPLPVCELKKSEKNLRIILTESARTSIPAISLEFQDDVERDLWYGAARRATRCVAYICSLCCIEQTHILTHTAFSHAQAGGPGDSDDFGFAK